MGAHKLNTRAAFALHEEPSTYETRAKQASMQCAGRLPGRHHRCPALWAACLCGTARELAAAKKIGRTIGSQYHAKCHAPCIHVLVSCTRTREREGSRNVEAKRYEYHGNCGLL